MKESVKLFLEKAQQDKELREKLQGVTEQFKDVSQNEETQEKALAAILPIAKNHGFDLKMEDFQAENKALSDDELANVVGGGGCGCAGAGGGGGTDSNDGNTYGCACAAYGQGGDGNIDDANCLCVVTGVGDDHAQFY